MSFVDKAITILNIFIVPFISVYLYYKNNKKKYIFNFETILYWAIFTCIVFLFSKIIYEIIYILLSIEGDIFSFQYCLIAVITSVLAPYILEFIIKRFDIKINNEKK